MIFVSPKPDEMKAAGGVAPNAQLDTVRLVSIATRGERPISLPMDGSVDADISFKLERYEVVETDRLEVTTSLRLNLTTTQIKPAPSGAKRSLTIELVFLTGYKLPSGPIPDEIGEAGLRAFARLNGLFTCWPYFRQELQHVIGAMGMPPFVLPPLIIRANKPEVVATQFADKMLSAPIAKKKVQRKKKPVKR